MRRAYLILLVLINAMPSSGQHLDSLVGLLSSKNDTLVMAASAALSRSMPSHKVDSVTMLASRYKDLAEKLDYKDVLVHAMVKFGMSYSSRDDQATMEWLYKAESLIDADDASRIPPHNYIKLLSLGDAPLDGAGFHDWVRAETFSALATQYYFYKSGRAEEYNERAIAIYRRLGSKKGLGYALLNKGLRSPDARVAIVYLDSAYRIAELADDNSTKFFALSFKANYLKNDGRWQEHFALMKLLDSLTKAHDDLWQSGWNEVNYGEYFQHTGDPGAAKQHYWAAIGVSKQVGVLSMEYWATRYLSDIYKSEGNADSALYYLDRMVITEHLTQDALEMSRIRDRDFKRAQALNAQMQENQAFRSKIKLFAVAGMSLVFIFLAYAYYRRSVFRKKAFELLSEEKARTDEALRELKATQSQLVQSEKMASLGELTAGIAHEIQNPLNFVNNFSEVNIELADDLVKAIDGKDLQEAKGLATDIKGNQEKIREHGKRADGIVKSMLQHSRASTGQKEPTDLAALADEYLKLAYHGMRAKDKDFNVTLETDFEPGLPKVNVIPQDIGRVLLNVYNNAFQAVMERKRSGEAGYEPKVRVEVRSGMTAETQRRGGTAGNSESAIRNPEWVRIAVSDNGSGVPESIRTKIFQPFFTTKPTGQGTGLGLSLSYDIVTKGHGGELFLEGDTSVGAAFIIKLPT